MKRAFCGQEVLLDDWTANVIREMGKRVLGVTFGRKVDEETLWWNEEVQEYVQGKI